MTGANTWLKQVGGALLACLLLVSFVAPSIWTGLCAGDAVVAVEKVVTAQAAGDADASFAGLDQREDGAADICLEGHCHHAPTLITAVLTDQTTVDVSQVLHERAMPAIPPSRAQDRLPEPPRA